MFVYIPCGKGFSIFHQIVGENKMKA